MLQTTNSCIIHSCPLNHVIINNAHIWFCSVTEGFNSQSICSTYNQRFESVATNTHTNYSELTHSHAISHLIYLPVGLDEINSELSKGSISGTSEGLWCMIGLCSILRLLLLVLVGQCNLRHLPSSRHSSSLTCSVDGGHCVKRNPQRGG